MNMKTLEISYPEDLPQAMGESPEDFERELKFLVAAKLHELGRISSGRAAEMAGMHRVEFLSGDPPRGDRPARSSGRVV